MRHKHMLTTIESVDWDFIAVEVSLDESVQQAFILVALNPHGGSIRPNSPLMPLISSFIVYGSPSQVTVTKQAIGYARASCV